MILSLFRKKPDDGPVYAVYRSIVAQSRQPVFYAQWGVPDTVTGRFDMISLHMALLFRRLRGDAKGAAGSAEQTQRDFSQAVFDLFFADMDRNLREMGVTDIGVPKKIQKMGNIFFGLLAAMNEAMDRNDEAALVGVLERNIYAEGEAASAPELARYLIASDRALSSQPARDIVGGTLTYEAQP